mgnify:CR=1 FL=1
MRSVASRLRTVVDLFSPLALGDLKLSTARNVGRRTLKQALEPMAEAARDYSRNRAVETLAQSIINSQTSEVETMTTMLEERGAKPLPG